MRKSPKVSPEVTERKVRKLRKTHATLKLASAYFAQAELDRQLQR